MSRASLKPQQRLKILRCFLVPHYYQQFVLAKRSVRVLKAMDRQLYVAVRKWLQLPVDVPIAYFHAACRGGGLGISSFPVAEYHLLGISSFPRDCMVFDHLTALKSSDSRVRRAAANNIWTQRRLQWATGLLERSQPPIIEENARTGFWRNRLYAMTRVKGQPQVLCVRKLLTATVALCSLRRATRSCSAVRRDRIYIWINFFMLDHLVVFLYV